MISVLCPSRGNPEWLKRSAKSLRSTARGEFELLVAADDDDPVTIETAAEAADTTVVLPRAGYARLHVYYQALADIAAGDWLLVWNDDCIMLTPGWDVIIRALPPEVLVADVQSPHSPLCCLPAVRRSAVEAIGTFSSDNPHIDTFWQDVANSLGVMRAVPVRASVESPVSANSHGFYEAGHQEQMAAYAQVLREALA